MYSPPCSTRANSSSLFPLRQWSRLALVGILAAELHVGGCNFGNLGRNWPRIPHSNQNEFLQSRVPEWLLPLNHAHRSEHIAQFIGLIVVGIFVAMVLGFVFLYISSVFRFILFDSVLRRECSIGERWGKWRRAGGRFFLWQIVFQMAAWLFLLVLVGVPLALALAAGWTTDLRRHIGRMMSKWFCSWACSECSCSRAVVQVLAEDFLVPIWLSRISILPTARTVSGNDPA